MSRSQTPSLRTQTARAVVTALLRHVRGGTIEVCDALGHEVFGSDAAAAIAPPLRCSIDVRDPSFYEVALRRGSIGLGESYADGAWETDDLAAFLRLAIRSLAPLHERQDRLHNLASPLIDPVARLRRSNPDRDARHVRAHYDIGNEFFRHVLDETMAYSCGIFETPETSLLDASRAKFDRLAHQLDLRPGDHLLEIGTGWAGFALHAAEQYGALVTTTTISERQYEFAQERVRAHGLGDRITVLDTDFRDLRGTFDKIVAIEMIEAVDWREYDTFFERMRALLRADGVLAMQAIVVPDQSFDRCKRNTDFIKAAIFPGGCLPSVGALTSAAYRSGGLMLQSRYDMGLHYGETLRRWRANLDGIAHELPALGLDSRFARLWAFYLAYCEAGFDERYIGVTQLSYAGSTDRFRPRSSRIRTPRDSVV